MDTYDRNLEWGHRTLDSRGPLVDENCQLARSRTILLRPLLRRPHVPSNRDLCRTHNTAPPWRSQRLPRTRIKSSRAENDSEEIMSGYSTILHLLKKFVSRIWLPLTRSNRLASMMRNHATKKDSPRIKGTGIMKEKVFYSQWKSPGLSVGT